MAFTKDEFLKALDCEIKKVTIPVWGEVYLKKFSGKLREQWERYCLSPANMTKGHLRAYSALLSVCDEAGNLLLNEAEHLEALANGRADILNVIYKEVSDLNSVTKEDIDALEGNSGPTP